MYQVYICVTSVRGERGRVEVRGAESLRVCDVAVRRSEKKMSIRTGVIGARLEQINGLSYSNINNGEMSTSSCVCVCVCV